MKITLGWWNTSLTSVAKKKVTTQEERLKALEVIYELLLSRGVSILALCEVSAEDIAFFKSKLGNLYECESYTEAFGHTKYDLGIVYKASDVEVSKHRYIKHDDEKWTYALAVQLDIRAHSKDFIFFISHWPSRRFKPHKSEERKVYGTWLRERIKESKFGDTPLIMAGDYNDEPFDDPLANSLKATRDRSRSRYYDHIFYNPFWRKIGEHGAVNGKEKTTAAGTYYHRSGKETKWYNFDSMIFSKHLLGKRGWHLAEDRTEIVTSDLLINLVYSSEFSFDHLPLTAVIEKNSHV